MKVFFLELVYIFNFDLFEFSAAILEKGSIAKRHGHIFYIHTYIHTYTLFIHGKNISYKIIM